MKKTSLIKGILLILLSVVLIGTTGVFAADLSSGLDDDLSDFTNTNTNTNTNTDTNTNSNVAENNAVNNSNSLVENTNVTNNTNKVNNTTNTNGTSNNSSVYNNTNNTSLPKTGIEDSFPTIALIVVFGISAVYAFNKIRDYKNI